DHTDRSYVDTGVYSSNAPPRSRTSSDSFEDCHASITPTGLVFCAATSRGFEVMKFTPRLGPAVARPGIEPGPTASEADMRSGTLTGPIQSFQPRGRTACDT